jgi:hypothetical protein
MELCSFSPKHGIRKVLLVLKLTLKIKKAEAYRAVPGTGRHDSPALRRRIGLSFQVMGIFHETTR